ncbi:hypothetical protein SAMN05216490_4246 [Mucilaginibacter mallensis]|uniref:DUF998 domain-containing protein n=1 Tax=Mucilaginibacter mallensis TaxID=652787 RepID=A0A1H2BPB2_MUCMA|nr:hypothetical protein [Mucilaginibacter mallensis]SDT59964.1 hypothetical protein SAMN05216490_4246 [Mucilaginibacter mallensis]
MKKQPNNDEQDMVISYLTIRKAVGVLGIALPVVLLLGTCLISHCPCIRGAISDYYYSMMSSYFTGTLCAVALFLFSYKGYDSADQISTNIAGVFALGVVFFPSNMGKNCTECNLLFLPDNCLRNVVHYGSAAGFFFTLAYVSIILFTKTNKDKPTPQKCNRNIIYKTCGYVIVAAMVLIGILKATGIEKVLNAYRPTFWLESLALWAFGFSWLIKGKTILQDE